jgi:LmeA-like phospholipid-binding
MRRLVIALLVLVGLLLVADFGTAALAESAVSRQMRAQLALADDPSVRINGFPFLTQAVAGEYSSVDVEAKRISLGQLRELAVRAQLRDVQAPLPMLLGAGPKTLQVRVAEGTVRIPANDVQRLLPGVQKLRIETVDEGALERAIDDGADITIGDIDPDRAVRLVGTSDLLGRDTEVAVIAVLELVDGQIRIVPRDIRLGEQDAPTIPAAAQQSLQRLFTLRIDPGSLPLQVTPTKLRATPDGVLELSGRARDLTLGGSSSASGG